MTKTMLFIIPLILCSEIKAQTFKNELEVNFGPQISSFYGNPEFNNFNKRLTFSVGANYHYHFFKSVSFTTGLFFEQKGDKVSVDLFDIAGNYTQSSEIIFNRNYLVVPLGCQFYTNTKVRLYFGGGLFVAFLLKGEDFNSQIVKDETFAASTQSFDFGINFGIGVLIPLNNRLSFDLRIKDNLGLFNTMTEELPAKNNTLVFSAGFRYKF